MNTALKKILLKIRNRLRNKLTILNGSSFLCDGNLLNSSIYLPSGNSIVFEEGVRLRNCYIEVRGVNNVLRVGGGSILSGKIELFGDGNELVIGKNTRINGADFIVHNGTSISVGDECLFSTNIDLRTTDSHLIYDVNGHRINPDKNIEIEDRVWLGRGVSVLKGAHIASGCVIGSMSLVSGFCSSNTICAGVPAKPIKEGISWEQ
ncbi:Acetyltransferase-like isoleucine patch superfamily enzyme [uncultured Thiomicrorhabdus sp.]